MEGTEEEKRNMSRGLKNGVGENYGKLMVLGNVANVRKYLIVRET